MSQIQIKSAQDKDSDQIAVVLLDFYNMKNKDEAIRTFKSESQKGYHYIVAKKNDQIIGLVTWLTHGLLKHGLFELDRICLLKESRGIGLGKTLVDKLIENARIFYKERSEKIRKLYLLTHEENKSAQFFYEKIGFSHEATLKDHYYRGKQEKVYSMFFN
jgi:ribosomal protein S18 acetylase RimI-like enzyme